MDPSPSVTLLSLSSLSDCNSTKSLLPSDPDDYPQTPLTGVKTPAAPPAPALNPLLDLRAESFKKEPNQSLTPTHVSAAMAMNRGHRRTPSDGAIRPRAQTLGHHRTPSDGSMPMPPPPGLLHKTSNKGKEQTTGGAGGFMLNRKVLPQMVVQGSNNFIDPQSSIQITAPSHKYNKRGIR